MSRCIGNDPGCPCQDGLACHYVDLPGSPAWPVPPQQPDLMALPASAVLRARRLSSKRGHAAPPGTGPEGETCGSCVHLDRRQMAKTYLKCGLERARWTGGGATDVRAKDAACRRWEASA